MASPPSPSSSLWRCLCGRWHSPRDLFFCAPCAALLCGAPRCSLESTELAACPRCLRTHAPAEAARRLRGRCGACLDCPRCGAAFGAATADNTAATHSHACAACGLRAKLRVDGGESGADAAVAAAAALLAGSVLFGRLLAPPPDAPTAAAAVALQRRVRQQQQQQRLHQARLRRLEKGDGDAEASSRALRASAAHVCAGLDAARQPQAQALHWFGLSADCARPDAPAQPPLALPRLWNPSSVVAGSEAEVKADSIVDVTCREHGARLVPLCQRRCVACLARGDPGILTSVAPSPFAGMAAGGAWTPARMFRKQSPALSLLPLLSIVPAPVQVSTEDGLACTLHLQNPTDRRLRVVFAGTRQRPVLPRGDEGGEQGPLLCVLDAQTGAPLLWMDVSPGGASGGAGGGAGGGAAGGASGIAGGSSSSGGAAGGTGGCAVARLLVTIGSNDPLGLFDTDDDEERRDGGSEPAGADTQAATEGARAVATRQLGAVSLSCRLWVQRRGALSARSVDVACEARPHADVLAERMAAGKGRGAIAFVTRCGY